MRVQCARRGCPSRQPSQTRSNGGVIARRGRHECYGFQATPRGTQRCLEQPHPARSNDKPSPTLGRVKEMRPIRPENNTLVMVKAVVRFMSLVGQHVLIYSGVLRNESWCNK